MRKFLIILLISFTTFSFKHGLVFASKLENETAEVNIIKELLVDITGDNVEETIILSGLQKEGSPYYDKIKITVSDDKTGKTKFAILPVTNYGYNPTIILEDFTGDGIKEVFYGASGGFNKDFGYFYLYSFNDGEVKTLFDYELDVNACNATLLDYYKIKLNNSKSEFFIDLSNKDKSLLNKFYKSNGKLIKKCELKISKVNYAYPYYDLKNNCFSLCVTRNVADISGVDVFCKIAQNCTFIN